MSNPSDARRRWFGLFFLFMALGLLIWGQTILKPHLNGLGFVLYWLLCFVFTMLAMLTALIDFWIVRHRTRTAHHDLLANALSHDDESVDTTGKDESGKQKPKENRDSP
jgi:hypothetical protein